MDEHIGNLPFEIGGILGSADGEAVTEIIMDRCNGEQYRCSYIPDVKYLNKCIAEWHEKSIRFMGVFHTHFANVKTLSQGDKAYITAIMNAMPDWVETLFFPVFILPKRELISYYANKKENKIYDDILHIV